MELSRTHHADQAANIADLVNLKFSGASFGTTTKRILRVTEPDGPSTDGGRKARQSIVLAPEEGSAGGVIVCGWLDVRRRTAELRSHLVISHAYQDRYGVTLDLARGEYQRALDGLFEFLRALEIDARLTNFPRKQTIITPLPTVQPKPPVRSKKWDLMLVASSMLFGFAVCYLLAALHLIGT
jgi:hypothetical protein